MDKFSSRWPLLQFLDSSIREKINCLHVFGKHGNNFVFTTNDDKVYYIAVCRDKKCIKGDTTFVPVLIEPLCGKKIAGFTASWDSYVVAYTESGELYSWGHKCYLELNYIYEQGIPDDKEYHIVQVLKDHKVIKVSCGAYHTVAVTANGEVYYWGRVKHSTKSDFIITTPQNPEKITCSLENKKIVDVACGKNFSIFIDDQGEVYGWGSNNKGQLASNNVAKWNMTSHKILIPNNKKIFNIACGVTHVLALSRDRVLYTWGNNMANQCGVLDSRNYLTEPFKLLAGVHEIGASHGCELSGAAVKGFIYVWGRGKAGVLIKKPKRTKYLDMIEAFVSFSASFVTPQNYVPKKELPSLSETIVSLFDNKEESDLAFKIGDKFIYTQKTLLMIRSNHLKRMLQGNWKESKHSVVDVTQYSYEVYRAYLEYLYLDRVNQDLSWNFVIALMDLANSYDEQKLWNICNERLKIMLTPNNVISVYGAAVLLQIEDLMERCIQFASRHLDKVVLSEDFKEMDPQVIKLFIRKVSSYKPFQTY